MSTLPVVLLAFANSRDESYFLRQLESEQEELEELFAAAGDQGLCELKLRSPCTIRGLTGDFQNRKLRDRVAILHYGGHATSYELLLQSATGETIPALADGLARFLAQQSGLKLVFLNGCSTRAHTDGLLQAGVSVVISTDRDLDDDVAREFAVSFYRGLAGGVSIRRAFEEAQAAVSMTADGKRRGAYFRSEVPAGTVPFRIAVHPEKPTADQWQLVARSAGNVPLQLPPAAGKYFGRKLQREELGTRLRQRRNTVVVGPAGIGKTALAAEAVRDVVGSRGELLSASPYPDGIVFVDLYEHHGQSVPAWTAIANAVLGSTALPNLPAHERAREACRGRNLLVIVEGFEEADGSPGRTNRKEFLEVLDPASTWLLLTRDNSQARPADRLMLAEFLEPEEAGALFDSLCGGSVTGTDRATVLDLLAGHPLALTWAGSLVASGDEDVRILVSDWQRDPLLKLSDPEQASNTLHWLFGRSVRALDPIARQALSAAGQLGRAPFPVEAIQAATDGGPEPTTDRIREAIRVLVQLGLLRRTEKEQREFTHVLGYQFARQLARAESGMRRRLSIWLQEELTVVIKHEQDLNRITALLVHADSLLEADTEGALWELAELLLYEAREWLVGLGQSGATQQVLQTVWDWIEHLPTEMARQPCWQGERGSCLLWRGDLAVTLGNLTEAQRLFVDAVELRKRLSVDYPGDPGWMRELSISLEKLAEVSVSLGNLAEAQQRLNEALEIAKRLAALAPWNDQFQRDLSISLGRLADLSLSLGDFAQAQRLFEQAEAISETLTKFSPEDAEGLRDQWIALNKRGDATVASGNLTEAQQVFAEGLEIAKQLAASEPGNAKRQRDLSVSLERLGSMAMRLGELPEAHRLLTEVLRISERLVALDPANAKWQRDLTVPLERLGDVSVAQKDFPEALQHFRRALEIRKSLVALAPENSQWMRDLWISYSRIAGIVERHDSLEARHYWSLTIQSLDQMIARGMFVSEADRQFLEVARQKLISPDEGGTP